MKHLPFAFLAALALAACGNTPSPTPAQTATAAPAEPLQCGKDTDCKGDRICEQGACVAPNAQGVLPAAGVGDALDLAADRATAAATEEHTPIPVCQANDPRTKVPVWEPVSDGKSGWKIEPPMNDGQIVYIRVSGGPDQFNCNAEDLQTVGLYETPGNALDGGLSVNIRGNTHFTNGVCFIEGFFMNENVEGIHQGWVETYFEAVPKQQVVLSDRYCLDSGS